MSAAEKLVARHRDRWMTAIRGWVSPRSPKKPAPTFTGARTRSPSWLAAYSASSSPFCLVSPGLGKTSILRAGLVPRLRGQGYCPVYVRIDYSREAPEPAEQIKLAIRRATSDSGEWSQAGVAIDNESLWEFLHHRDDVLRDSSGTTLIPLLIFDQFEEIFTLAQSDDFGRARAARFIEELADLVENRPPEALEQPV